MTHTRQTLVDRTLRIFSASTFLFTLGASLPGCDAGAPEDADVADETVSQAAPGAPTTEADADFEVRVKDANELARMEQYTRDLYDPQDVLHAFRTRGGDLVDCVDIYAQPSLRSPEMRGHQIELAPKTWPKERDGDLRRIAPDLPADQDFIAVGGEDEEGRAMQCPEGSIPVRRPSIETLKRFRTLEDYFAKYPSHLSGGTLNSRGHFDRFDRRFNEDDIEDPAREGSNDLHQYGVGLQWVNNWGAESNLNLWSPYVERSNEFSLSQIWVTRGGGSSLETVEAGWQLYKDKYGDWRSRLFIYFTPDNYGSGGCYNLDCSGFVQTNSSVYIGGGFSTYSATGGSQYSIKLLWYKDGTNGHWWLRYGDTWVGYYPRTKFDSNGLINQGDRVDFGGEIIDRQVNGRHTYTDMGSGGWPEYGWAQAAFQRNLYYVDTNNYYQTPSLSLIESDWYCYGILQYYDASSWGRYVYFGGAGYNSECQ